MNEDRATRYHRLKRRVDVAALAWSAALLAAVLFTGASASLRTWAAAITGAGPTGATTVVVYSALLMLLHDLASLPLAFYSGFALERRYGLSNERLAGWLRDQAKSLGIGLLLGAGAVSILYACIRRWPEFWWAPAGLAFAFLVVGLANLAPVLLLPLFYRIEPLQREELRRRLVTLAERCGARVVGAYEWGLGEKTKKANAALAGLGRTRRILVSDTMLADYSDEEIEVVLAHELAHHVHGDIWKGLLFESALILGAFWVAGLVLDAGAAPLGLTGAADPAGLPLLLLAAGAVSIVLIPVAQAVSRAHERKADRFALELTRNPAAFISAMRRLGSQNLAEEHPSRLTTWLFYSHPPLAERIASAEGFGR